MSGSCSASWLRAARRLPDCSGCRAETHGLEGRAWKARRRLGARRWHADRIADTGRAKAADRRHLAGSNDRRPRRAGRCEDVDRRRLALLPVPDTDSHPRPQRAAEQPHVGDPFAGGRPFDLEDATRHRSVGIAVDARQEVIDAREQLADPDAVRGRSEVDGVDRALARLCRRGRHAVADHGMASSSCTNDRIRCVVVVGQGLAQGRPEGVVARGERDDRRIAAPLSDDPAHRDDPRREPASHRRDDAVRIGAGPVHLVDEEDRRDPQAPERAEQQWRLRLDAFDRRDDQDGPVEHAEDAFDLGDEVRVAGRVDEVDREVADEERGDRGADRDAAFALEVERVGLGGAGVDAADVIDRAGGEEESFAESGLTGVDVREDAEVERTHGASCLPRRWSPSG